MKDELRVIPKKNYLILVIVLLLTVLAVYYFYMWNKAYNESKINEPVLDKYMMVINYNELGDYLIENPDTIVYTSILGDMNIRGFENRFKNYIKNDKLEHEVLYMDITSEIKNNNKKNDMMKKYSIEYANIFDVPNVMVFENGKLMMIYNIQDNDYDVKKTVEFINSIKINEGDNIND